MKTNIKYNYPVYPWKREWSQYYIYQWHLTEYGPPYYLGFRFGPPNVRKTLEQIKKIDNVTRGIPKVILLCGWQQFVEGKVTWDTQFPSFVTTANNFKNGSIGPAADDAIRWLMLESKKYNTLVSFHLDFALVQKHSALWQKYHDLDLLCKNENGEIKSYGHWEGRVNLQKEFDAGLFQARMADFFEKFPEVLETGCVHNDWNCADDSPWHGYTREDDAAALNRNIAWIKQTYGVDTAGELIVPGSYGMQFLALSFNRYDFMRADQTKVPAYIFCGGHGGAQTGAEYTPGALLFPNDSLLFGASNQGEFGYNYTNDENNPGYENNLFRDFCYSTLPWYYLNRLLRLSIEPAEPEYRAVMFSDGVKSFIDENGRVCITKNGDYIRCGNDIFIPELWKPAKTKEIMAWSDDGYINKTWKLPEDWDDVSAVDLYDNTLGGLRLRKNNVKIEGAGFLTLSLSKKDGVIIVPAGADPNDMGETPPPSGTAEFIGQDTKTAYSGNIPEYATVKFISGAAKLHEIIDVDVGENTKNISLYFINRENKNCQIVLEAIDANSIERLGSGGNTRLLNICKNGVYVKYKISGHVRFRATRLNYDGFGRGDGGNESAPADFAGVVFDN